MKDNTNEIVNTDGYIQTPTVIKVMLVLTYISFGFQFFGLFISWLMKDIFYNLEDKGNNLGNLLNMLENTQYVIVHLSALVIGLVGAVILWKMKRIGLYLYLVAKLILLTDAYAFGIQSFSLIGFIFGFIIWAIWPVVFIVHYKQMR